MIATNRRVYYLRLISTNKTPQLCVCFRYPLSMIEDNYSSIIAPSIIGPKMEETAVGLGKSVADLNFNYQIVGKASWETNTSIFNLIIHS